MCQHNMPDLARFNFYIRNLERTTDNKRKNKQSRCNRDHRPAENPVLSHLLFLSSAASS